MSFIMAEYIAPPKHESRLVSWYQNKVQDDAGRFISEIMEWNHQKLEDTHDYIQWLFPLPEESMVSNAPLIDANVFAAFHHSPELRSNLKKALVKMLDFYGFEFAHDLNENDLPVIIKSPKFNDRSDNWLVTVDHNHLRISRILRSLRILGLELEAIAFYKALSDIIHHGNKQMVSSQSAAFWRRASQRPIHWAPHMSEDACEADRRWLIGPDFLRSFAKTKLARDLQLEHDAAKILEDKKEAEFQATKAYIASINAGQKRKVNEANVSPQLRAGSSRESDDRISESQLDKKEVVVANTRELTPEAQEVIVKKDGMIHDASEPVGQKALVNGGQSLVHEIQQYQLMAPRQP